MPSPTKNMVHVNKPLTEISVAYVQKQTTYIADKVFPVVPVEKQGDRYFVYDKGDWLRDEAQKRADASESAGSGFDIDNTPSYYADVYAHHKDIGSQVRANADKPIDLDRDAAEFVTQKLLLKREKTWISKYFTTGLWGTDFTPGTLWSAAGGDPMKDIDLQTQVIKGRTGYKPNVLVLGSQVFSALKSNPQILDRIKYTQKGVVTVELLAGLFEVEKVLVADAVENTAKKGAATAVSFMFGKHALLVYANPSPSILTPSGGYTFAWKGLGGEAAYAPTISKFYMDAKKCDRVEGELAYDQKLVAADMGVFINGAIA